MLRDNKIIVDDKRDSIEWGKTVKHGRKDDIFQTIFLGGNKN